VPGGFSSWVSSLLVGLLNPSAKKRLTAEEALSRLRAPEEESTRRPMSRLSGYTSTVVSASQSATSSFHPDMFGKSPSSRAGSFFPAANNALRHHSRYRTDFEEVEFLVSWDQSTHSADSRVKVLLARLSRPVIDLMDDHMLSVS
jgi:hypothetical protein